MLPLGARVGFSKEGVIWLVGGSFIGETFLVINVTA